MERGLDLAQAVAHSSPAYLTIFPPGVLAILLAQLLAHASHKPREVWRWIQQEAERWEVWSSVTPTINETSVHGLSLLALEMGKKPASGVGAATSDLITVDGGMTGMVILWSRYFSHSHFPIYVQILSDADTKTQVWYYQWWTFWFYTRNLLGCVVKLLLGQAPCHEDMGSGEISVVHVAEWINQSHRQNSYSNHWIGGWVLLRAFLDVVVDTKVTSGARNWILVIQSGLPDLPVLGAEKLLLLDVESLQLCGS